MKRFVLLLGVLFVGFLLASCAPAATPTPEAEPTSVPATEAAATEVPEVEAQPTEAEEAEGPKHHRFAFLVLQSGAKRYFSADIPNMEEVANAAGYELLVQSAENDAKTQLDQAEFVLAQGIDVLIVQPVNNEAAASIVEKANAEGVPVISYNDLVFDADIVAFVGRDPVTGGRVSAEAALEVHPTGNYVLISGEPASTVAQGFMQGYHEILDPEVEKGNIKIVSEQYSPAWKTEPAIAQIENALTQNDNDVQAVLTAYDAMAFGVMDVLESNGLLDKVVVTGQDVIPGGAQAIVEGRLFGSVWGEFGEMGKRAGETAVDVAEGREFAYDGTIDNGFGQIPWVQAAIYLVTNENMPEFVCTHQWWIPVEEMYENLPEEEWPDCEEILGAEPTGAEAVKEPEYRRFAFLVLQSGAKRYFSADIPNMEEVANAAGYELLVQSAENDAKTQLDQAEFVLAQGIDVLIVQPVNNEAAASIVEKANAEGVPVISYNDLVFDADIVAFVGRDPVTGGRVSAEAALEVHPTGNYVLISGEPASTVAQGFMQGYHEILDPEVEKGNIKIVSEQYSPAWKTEPAIAQIENALTQNDNDVQAVLTAYDAMAFGVMDVLESNGLLDKVVVTGQDVIPGGAQAIVEGRLFGSVWGEFGEMGKRAGETAVDVAEGREFAYDGTIDNGFGQIPWVQAAIYLVTNENMPEFVCTHQWWIPVEEMYENLPEEEWPDCEEVLAK